MRRNSLLPYMMLLATVWMMSLAMVIGVIAGQPVAVSSPEGTGEQFGPPAPPSDEVMNEMVYARLSEARKAEIKPHDFEFYTLNWLYSEAKLTLRVGGKTYTRVMPKLDKAYSWDTPSVRVIFPNVKPEDGFSLTVRTKNGKKFVFSVQPMTTPNPIGPGYLHVCDDAHLYLNGPEIGFWPVGHEGNSRPWYQTESCNGHECPRSIVTYDAVLKH